MVKEAKTKAEFDAELVNAGDKLVVVDFTATWCGPCQRIKPEFEKLSAEFTNVVFIKVDVDENAVSNILLVIFTHVLLSNIKFSKDTAGACNIKSMPTFQFYKKNAKVDEFSGADPAKLRASIEKLK